MREKIKSLLDSRDRAQLRQAVELAAAALPPAEAAAALGELPGDPRDIAFLLMSAVASDDAAWFPAWAWASDCAERALPLFEEEFPQDPRPRQALAATRAYARGEIDRMEWRSHSSAASQALYHPIGSGGARQPRETAAYLAAEAINALFRLYPQQASYYAPPLARRAIQRANRRPDDFDGHAAGAAERAWQRARLIHYLAALLDRRRA